MTADRKTIKRNLMDLIDFGYPINYKEIERNGSVICTDLYYEHSFTASELRLIIDSIIFSKNMNNSQCRQLIKKLSKLSSKYFKNSSDNAYTLRDSNYKQLFYTIDILNEAIETHKKVVFKYNSYGTDKKLHPRTDKTGKTKLYTISPYQLAAANGRYYLICNYKKYDIISNFRVDRISNIKLLDTPAGSFDKIDVEVYMNEHLYMFSGNSVNVKFRASKMVLNDIIDWFGTEINIFDESEQIIVTAKVNETAFYKWAIQYCEFVEVIEPKKVRKNVGAALKKAIKKYGI